MGHRLIDMNAMIMHQLPESFDLYSLPILDIQPFMEVECWFWTYLMNSLVASSTWSLVHRGLIQPMDV